MPPTTPVQRIAAARLCAICLGLAGLAVAGGARAQDPSGHGQWTFEIGAGTDNRSKDLSKSNGDPYAFGEVEWSGGDGLIYVGSGFETIDASTGSRLELELSAGLRPQIAGFDLDLNAARKFHVDADPGADDQVWEFTADIRRSVGPASARLRLQHSPDGSGATRAWTWVAGQVGWELAPRLSASAEVGRREQDGAVDYTGWNAGVAFAASRSVELELRWHDNDSGLPGAQYASALVASVSVGF